MALELPIPLPFDRVFAYGLWATGEVSEEKDYDKPGRPPKVDAVTGKRMYSFSAIDADPGVRGPAKTVKVVVLADVQPMLPAPAGDSPFVAVELDGLTVRPYVAESANGRARLAFSYRAIGVRAPKHSASGGSKPAAA